MDSTDLYNDALFGRRECMMKERKYVKKPIVISAYQTSREVDIKTLEGTYHASIGDYIITGIHGEKYPCKPDIFEETYRPLEEKDINKDDPNFHEQYLINVCKDFLDGNITEEELKADIFNENYRIVKLTSCPDWLLDWAGENPGAARMALIKEYIAEVEILASIGMTDKQGRYIGCE